MPAGAGITGNGFRGVTAAMRLEEDGAALRLDLMRELRKTAASTVKAMQQSIETAPANSAFLGEPLRQGIADRISAQMRLSPGRRTGISIRARKVPNIRGFRNAPKAFNLPRFRHRVYGRNAWVSQVGKPNWFDDAAKAHRREFEVGVNRAVLAMAVRLATRSRGA